MINEVMIELQSLIDVEFSRGYPKVKMEALTISKWLF